jgi:hypothetical protein
MDEVRMDAADHIEKAFAQMVVLVLAANVYGALIRNQSELHRCIGKNKMVD